MPNILFYKKGFSVGDRVKILETDIFPLRTRFKKGPVYGRITEIDGQYILVRPMWCKWEVELYPNEISK